ncbi:MAG: C4-type zinc ribbon domain-containing protein [Cyclobacteriaceae bacterium]|nr:C4-type zinc ribbon domain-containing protein [Cyclobacteriaceae bacterium]
MESTIPQKLEALAKLQEIDSTLDEIFKVRGALPDEVRDLEDEIAGYQTRIDKFNTDLEGVEAQISDKKTSIKESEALIKKYNEQQTNVRNNREYDAITKEMELQALEIQINEKRIKEAFVKIEAKKEEISNTQSILDERKKDLDTKKSELDVISSESQEEENKLMGVRQKAQKKVEERLLTAYERIRGNARNGLAVVSVKRDACGGCFNVVPPQRQADIKDRKKLIVCEHCGRILADVEFVIVEEKPKRTTRKKKVEK